MEDMLQIWWRLVHK